MKAKLLLIFVIAIVLTACGPEQGIPRSVTTNYIVTTRCGSGLGQGSTVNTYAMMNEPQKLKDAQGSEYYDLGGPGFMPNMVWANAVNQPKQTITEGYCAVSWDEIPYTFTTNRDVQGFYIDSVTEEEMTRFESFLNK